MICGSVVCEDERHGLVCFAHDALATSECACYTTLAGGALREARSEAKCHCVVLPPLCALYQLLRILQKQDEAVGGATAAHRRSYWHTVE